MNNSPERPSIRILIRVMTAKLLRGAITAKSIRDSSRSNLKRVSITEEKHTLQGARREVENLLREA